MTAVRLMTVGVALLGLVAGVRAEEKKVDKDKLVGTWEVTKADEGAPPVGSVIMFAKEGKMKLTHKMDGKEMTADGTYTLDGDKLSVTLKIGDKENKHTVTIKKLTATEMVAVNGEGKMATFKKK